VSQVEFAACYQAEMPGLVRFMMRCGAAEQDAVDAAQDAFTALYQKWGSVRHPARWLRTVALRSFLRQPVTGRTPLDESYDRAGPLSASARIELDEEDRAVLAACRQLPMTQRAVFALHFDQFSNREIAEMLAMKEPAVRKNLERARAALRKLL
jgi:RNA polymerase sigma factor (sigma-70 family)